MFQVIGFAYFTDKVIRIIRVVYHKDNCLNKNCKQSSKM
jgi:hypothetical protein